MKKLLLLAALAAMLCLVGCARTSTPAARSGPPPPRVTGYGPVTTAGLKPVSQVSACCADLAAGRISLAECFARPACKAKGNTCCMNAVQDMAPARI